MRKREKNCMWISWGPLSNIGSFTFSLKNRLLPRLHVYTCLLTHLSKSNSTYGKLQIHFLLSDGTLVTLNVSLREILVVVLKGTVKWRSESGSQLGAEFPLSHTSHRERETWRGFLRFRSMLPCRKTWNGDTTSLLAPDRCCPSLVANVFFTCWI